MGFKRTSEGRVFFKGADYSANDGNAKKERVQKERMVSLPRDQTQLQILTLLKTLNEKLKSTQVDRRRLQAELDAYKHLVEDLESKTDRSAQAYIDLDQKIKNRDGDAQVRVEKAESIAQETIKELEKTRKTLLALEQKTTIADQGVSTLKSQIVKNAKISKDLSDRQIELEKQQKEHSARITSGMKSYSTLVEKIQQTAKVQNDMKDRLAVSASSVDDLSARVQTTEKKQKDLDTKIVKVAEDRVRFMRKIELIEETVIQTRDALQANPAGLLSNGGTKQIESDASSQYHGQDHFEGQGYSAFWRKPMRVQALAIVFLIVAGVLIGWVVNEAQRPQISALDDFDLTILDQQEMPFDTAKEPQHESSVNGVLQEPGTVASQSLKVFSYDEEKELLDLFERDPDELARRLNDIEPSDVAIDPPAKVAEVAPVKPKVAVEPPPEKVASVSPQKSEPKEAVVKAPVVKAKKTEPKKQVAKPKAKKKSVSAAVPSMSHPNIEPDLSLPEFIKEIEAKAFDGNPEAQHDLAAIYTAGHADVPQNYDRASFWFRQAAQNGVANARYNLGVLYHQGLGVRQDMSEAIKWYKSAASLNHPEAQYNLGIAYIEGIGVNYDPGKAAKYFEKAANGGIMEAAYNLGLIYENGLLGQSQPDEALLWYKTAADHGSPEAKAALRQLAKTIGIEFEDVNALVDNVRKVKKSKPNHVEDSYDEFVEPEKVSLVNPKHVLVSQIQEYLIEAGLYPGPADGINGPQTKDAIRTYQSSNDLGIDGRASEDLLRHMLVSAKNYDVPSSEDVGSREQ